MNRKAEDILDELLVIRAQDGDKQAFSLLFRKWNGLVRHKAYRITSDYDGAKDVAQECWLAIAGSLRRLQDPAKFRGWIGQIIHNKSIDWIRSASKSRDLQNQYETEMKVPSDGPLSSEGSEPVTLLRMALAKLTDIQRSILTLFYLERLTVKELSSVLDIPVGTVKSRLFKARRALLLEYKNIEK